LAGPGFELQTSRTRVNRSANEAVCTTLINGKLQETELDIIHTENLCPATNEVIRKTVLNKSKNAIS